MPDSSLLESRTVSATFEVRDADSTAPVLEGYAATFDQPYDIGPFREIVSSSAFNRTLSGQPDVRLLVDHAGQPLARTKSGTLDLSPDTKGLHMRSTLDPSDPDVQRLLPKVRRGDLDQMSFAFRVPAGGDSWSDDYATRTLREVNMSGGDVSVVTYPANPSTQVQLRSSEMAEAEVTLAMAMLTELRSGKVLSSANADRLRTIIAAHEKASGHMAALGEAAAQMASTLPSGAEDPAGAQRSAPADGDFADPGYQSDGKKRYPVDTEAHVRAAWSFINQADNASRYSADDLEKVKANIKAAAAKFGVDIAGGANSRPLDLARRVADALRLSV